jgi:rhodanese-related sulfurtransferase
MATEVTIDELADVIDRGGFVLDVREDHEWQEGHVPNAHHIPMNEVAENLDRLDDGARIFIICKLGGRSMTVANYLEAQGYDVVSVAGGTDGWVDSGRNLSNEPSL